MPFFFPRNGTCFTLLLAFMMLPALLYCNGAFSDATEIEEIWFGEPVIAEGDKLSFNLKHPEVCTMPGLVPLELEIMTNIPYQQAVISVIVEDLEENTINESATTLDLHRGRNDVTVQWDPSALSPGKFFLLVMIDYADKFSPARYLCPINRVSSSHWRQEIQALQAEFAQLESCIKALAAEPGSDSSGSNSPDNAPYLLVRATVVQEALAKAGRALEGRLWQVADRNLVYAREAMDITRAEITFSKSMPELLRPHAAFAGHIEFRDAGLYRGSNPIFLLGAAVEAENQNSELAANPQDSFATMDASSPPDKVAWLKNHGLNLAVLSVPVGSKTEELKETIVSLASKTAAIDMPWLVQLNQSNIAGPIMDAWPELLEPGFVNMAHGGFLDAYAVSARELAALAGGQPHPPIGLCIADNPQFKYAGENVRLQFVAAMKERYPDRIELNRFWHAHLADYDEIEIWGEPEEYSYQNKRAYQYEWQTFHRGLTTLFFSDLKQQIAAIAPHVPVSLNLPEAAFMPGETRYTPGREDMGSLMDINGCSASFEAGTELYAINYPVPHAYISLMRTYAGNKPVLILDMDINVDNVDNVPQREAIVHSAVWEAIMSGANGMALAADSSVFQFPETLAAYAHAAMDVNRLAPVITAFQKDPAQIAILFSEASKIMDDGVPHLESARYAFEGASFSGFPIRFLTEKQIENGGLENIKVLIIPNTMAVPDGTFAELSKYVEAGHMVARVGTPIPYNEKGNSRNDLIRATANTILVRGMNLPTEYLHAMDAALVGGVLPEIARPVNAYGYPIEGVRSRYVKYEGKSYLYIINLRHTPVTAHLTGLVESGRDLVRGRDIHFPRELPPLDPMLIELDEEEAVLTVVK